MTPEDFAKVVSAETADWERERITRFWDPGRKLLRALRRYQAARARISGPVSALLARYWSVNHKFWSLITQSEIPLTCEIGGGLMLPHPTGIILHPSSRIGPNCLIFHQVTLAGPVTLGGHCDIGSGAKLLGPLTVGAHVQIGANSVVTTDLPDKVIAVGIPAKVIAR